MKSLKFKKSKLTLDRGASGSAATSNPAEASVKSGEVPKVWYVTSNKDVVAADEDGNFYPMGVGQAKVTAFCGNKKAVCSVIVSSYTRKISITGPDGADCSRETFTMKAGEQACYAVSFFPCDTTDPKNVAWKSSDRNVTVKNGIVTVKDLKQDMTAPAAIQATVKATDPETGKMGNISATFYVKALAAETPKAASADKTHTLSLKKKSMKLNMTDEGSTLDIVITPKNSALSVSDGSFKIDSVYSSDPDVVKTGDVSEIRASGKKGEAQAALIPVNPGMATIVVKSTAYGDSFNVQCCKVTVAAPVSALSIGSGTLAVSESGGRKELTMRLGTSGTVDIKTTPEITTDQGKIKLSGSGGITIKNGLVYANKVTKSGNYAKLAVKCGKLTDTVYVTVTE